MANRENPFRGARFEEVVQAFFRAKGLQLQQGFQLQVGVGTLRRQHKFDLGCPTPPTLVECKNHTWTEGGNAPSAKLTVWNEAMLYFLAIPSGYRRILAVVQSLRNGESLAEHYVRRFAHLVPTGVEIWELAPDGITGRQVHPAGS